MTLKSYILEPAKFKLDGGGMYGIIPKPVWNKLHPADRDNRVDLSMRLMLLELEDHLVLIDTGLGDYHGEKFEQRFDVREHHSNDSSSNETVLENCLKSIGKHSDDITDLIITHLHFDHVGGLSKKVGENFIPQFKNAKIYLHKNHYEYALNPTARDRGSFHQHIFAPLLQQYQANNQLVLLEQLSGELFAGLKYKVSFGHTPYLLHPYNDDFLYLSDLIPTSNHLHLPWVMGYDIAPGETTVNKQKFLEFIQEHDLTMIFEHDPEYWGAKLGQNEKKAWLCREKYQAKNTSSYLMK